VCPPSGLVWCTQLL